MTDHLHDRDLARLLDGALAESDAVRIALHLDDCPLCATRLATRDPLSRVFANQPDPRTPTQLAARALHLATTPTGPSQVELRVACGLLAAAAMVALSADAVPLSPFRLTVGGAALVKLTTQISGLIASSSVAWIVFFGLGALSLAIAAQLSDQQRAIGDSR